LLELKHLLLQADNFLSDPAVIIPESQADDIKGMKEDLKRSLQSTLLAFFEWMKSMGIKRLNWCYLMH